MRKITRFVLLLLLLVVSTIHESYAGLVGSSVTTTHYYPNLSTVLHGPTNYTIASGGTDVLIIQNGFVHITDLQIIWNATTSVTYASGSFNGFDFIFSGAPEITSITNDSATSINGASFSLVNNHEVQLNVAGLSAQAGQQIILDVVTASSGSAPEPTTLSLILLGLTGMAFGKCRKLT